MKLEAVQLGVNSIYLPKFGSTILRNGLTQNYQFKLLITITDTVTYTNHT